MAAKTITVQKITVKTIDGETLTGYWRSDDDAEDNIVANMLCMFKDVNTPNLIHIPIIRIKTFETEIFSYEK